MEEKSIWSSLLQKVFHIEPKKLRNDKIRTLEQQARESLVQPYFENDPSIVEWFTGFVPSRDGAKSYLRELFPAASWTRRYNLQWMIGDAIAGLTVGLVVVPQAMAYALLARLSPGYGLYTSFTGVALYWMFGTSKDIVIGATAVGSLLVGGVIANVEAEKPGIYTPQEIAHTLTFLSGLILLFLGLFRLGWLIEFIPYVPISAFVTSASITIMSTQIPVALGIEGINTREAPYLVLSNTLKSLPHAKVDAAIGITSILLLFAIRDACARMEIRQPRKKKMWAMLSSLRLTFTILLYTFISWLVHRTATNNNTKFRIVGHIERGFKHASIPNLDPELLGLVASELPAIVIILIVEHIAIAKSFGRIFGYTVVPSQEILASGAANILSPFVGGYVCTGSFGASAVLSKAGSRTPLGGLFSAMILVLALYALTSIFFFIPMAALAGLIIHATCNLITPPRALYKYWQLSPFEFLIWVVGVTVALFTSLEASIYATIALSFMLLLIRLARTPGKLSGRVRVSRIDGDIDNDRTNQESSASAIEASTHAVRMRNVYVPMEGKNAYNAKIKAEPPYPGVFVYRFNENFNYVNQARHMDQISSYIFAHTRRTLADDGVPLEDRLWNDAPPPPKDESAAELPLLRALILDFSAVNILDITSMQGLIDLRNTLDRYGSPAVVEWHFAGVHNRWTRRALAFAGFGYPPKLNSEGTSDWSPAYTVATSLAGATADDERQRELMDIALQAGDEERRKRRNSHSLRGEGRRLSKDTTRPKAIIHEDKSTGLMEPLFGIDRPFFHIDIEEAVDEAVKSAKRKDEELNEASHGEQGVEDSLDRSQ
ncbi:sulfate permease-like protein [Polyplosphaeria fusca]|uniref:Sulfate permease-like protein n=1 Tax=Polyplosphaeria fusca TaxID=682080 RepID=A0A9P4UZG2_9PLEO|nr:sulfate permease-like protein [Polyplosphaeria fusca]